MKVNILVISSLLGVLGMITNTQSLPMEVVYTGDSCDCPRNLNYLVNVPPPPKTNEYKTSEYGYQVDVPVPTKAKAKVTYSFDFTVQEPKIPPPTEQEKWNLYAKIDRITAHKKDCYANESPSSPSSNTCGCNPCKAWRSNSNRYVSPEAHAIRNIRKVSHPNSISKIEPSHTKLLAIFLPPLDQTQNIVTKTRKKRDISRIFLRGGFRNNKNVKRPERLVKQYNKRLQSRTESPAFFAETPLPSKTATPMNRRPFDTLKNLLVPPRLRSKRDIKGEYDLIEKEREQLDLTLPEIIQYMPETLNPNFKRGQCQFSHLNELQEPLAHNPAMESITATNDNVKETLKNLEATSNDSNGESKNAISSTHKKRNAADYDCGLNVNAYNPQLATPTPTPGYGFQQYGPATLNPNYDARPRPFTVTGSSFGIDPSPQQYVGAPHAEIAQPLIYHNAPLVGGVYSPHGQHASNAQLDQIIADIVNRHSDFIEASTHPGGRLVDATEDQVYHTKSLLKTLWDGHWQKWFADEPMDNTYSFMPYYRTPAPAPSFAPLSY